MVDSMTTASSSTGPQSALPEAWAERLFQVMEDRYGSLWVERYGAFPRERVKRSWAEDLRDMTREELARGVSACRDQRFPPTIPEFRQLCRPSVDLEVLFLEAVEQMRLREEGRDTWSSPAVFWAAASLGNDLRHTPYGAIKNRWAAALDTAKAKIASGHLVNGVPVRMAALPAPSGTTDAKVAKASLEVMQGMTGKSKDPLAWARRIMERKDAGECMPFMSVQFAMAALGIEGEAA